jgi:hypothetical protein
MGAYLLAWPLFVCAQAPDVPDNQREWIRGRLLQIGRHFGLDEREVFALSRRHVLTNAASFV